MENFKQGEQFALISKKISRRSIHFFCHLSIENFENLLNFNDISIEGNWFFSKEIISEEDEEQNIVAE